MTSNCVRKSIYCQTLVVQRFSNLSSIVEFCFLISHQFMMVIYFNICVNNIPKKPFPFTDFIFVLVTQVDCWVVIKAPICTTQPVKVRTV